MRFGIQTIPVQPDFIWRNLALFFQSDRKEFMKKFSIAVMMMVLAGCSATSVNPNASHVRVTNNEPGKECKFLGDITGGQGNFFTGGWTSNSNLETGARNDLKNQAANMGGNVVSIITQRAGQTGSSWDGSGSLEQTNVTLTGNVYRCPE